MADFRERVTIEVFADQAEKQIDSIRLAIERLEQAQLNQARLDREAARQARSAAAAARAAAQQRAESNRRIRDSQRDLERSQRDLSRSFGALSGQIGSFVRTFLLVGSIRTVVRDFAQFEDGLIAIQKTTGDSAAEISTLGERIVGLSTRIPVATRALLEAGAAAGQLGIRGTEELSQYIETVGRLGLATDLSGAQAVRALGLIQAVTGETGEDIGILGSVITRLGNNFIVTESQIARTATRIAQSTSQFNVSSDQVAGLATALGAVGIEAERGGSSIGRVLTTISRSIAQGTLAAQRFADIAGQSIEDFSESLDNNAIGGLDAFIRGLSEIREEGRRLDLIFDELSIINVRDRQTIGALARSYETLSTALGLAAIEAADAAEGQGELGALFRESETRATSLASQFQRLRNSITAVAVSTGEQGGLLNSLKDLTTTLADGVFSLAGYGDQLEGTAEQARRTSSALQIFGAALLLAPVATVGQRLLRVVANFNRVARATGAAGGAVAAFWSLLRRSPIGLIVTTLGAAVAAVEFWTGALTDAVALTARQQAATDRFSASLRRLEEDSNNLLAGQSISQRFATVATASERFEESISNLQGGLESLSSQQIDRINNSLAESVNLVRQINSEALSEGQTQALSTATAGSVIDPNVNLQIESRNVQRQIGEARQQLRQALNRATQRDQSTVLPLGLNVLFESTEESTARANDNRIISETRSRLARLTARLEAIGRERGRRNTLEQATRTVRQQLDAASDQLETEFRRQASSLGFSDTRIASILSNITNTSIGRSRDQIAQDLSTTLDQLELVRQASDRVRNNIELLGKEASLVEVVPDFGFLARILGVSREQLVELGVEFQRFNQQILSRGPITKQLEQLQTEYNSSLLEQAQAENRLAGNRFINSQRENLETTLERTRAETVSLRQQAELINRFGQVAGAARARADAFIESIQREQEETGRSIELTKAEREEIIATFEARARAAAALRVSGRRRNPANQLNTFFENTQQQINQLRSLTPLQSQYQQVIDESNQAISKLNEVLRDGNLTLEQRRQAQESLADAEERAARLAREVVEAQIQNDVNQFRQDLLTQIDLFQRYGPAVTAADQALIGFADTLAGQGVSTSVIEREVEAARELAQTLNQIQRAQQNAQQTSEAVTQLVRDLSDITSDPADNFISFLETLNQNLLETNVFEPLQQSLNQAFGQIFSDIQVDPLTQAQQDLLTSYRSIATTVEQNAQTLQQSSTSLNTTFTSFIDRLPVTGNTFFDTVVRAAQTFAQIASSARPGQNGQGANPQAAANQAAAAAGQNVTQVGLGSAGASLAGATTQNNLEMAMAQAAQDAATGAVVGAQGRIAGQTIARNVKQSVEQGAQQEANATAGSSNPIAGAIGSALTAGFISIFSSLIIGAIQNRGQERIEAELERGRFRGPTRLDSPRGSRDNPYPNGLGRGRDSSYNSRFGSGPNGRGYSGRNEPLQNPRAAQQAITRAGVRRI